MIKFYKEHGVAPREKKCGCHLASKWVLSYEDIQRIVHFVNNFADVHAMLLPGRIPGFKRADILVLLTTKTKSSLWRKYETCVIMVIVFLNLDIYICIKCLSAQASGPAERN